MTLAYQPHDQTDGHRGNCDDQVSRSGERSATTSNTTDKQNLEKTAVEILANDVIFLTPEVTSDATKAKETPDFQDITLLIAPVTNQNAKKRFFYKN